MTIDVTNQFGAYPPGVDSLAGLVKSIVAGPTAKAFNTIFATTYDQVDADCELVLRRDITSLEQVEDAPENETEDPAEADDEGCVSTPQDGARGPGVAGPSSLR